MSRRSRTSSRERRPGSGNTAPPPHFHPDAPLLRQLQAHGYELDQMLRCALERAASRPDVEPEDCGMPDSYLLLAAYHLNTTITQLVDLNNADLNLFHDYRLAPRCPSAEVVPGRRLCNVLNRAVARSTKKTIGVGDFLRAVVEIALDEDGAWEAPGFPGQVIHETFSIETLMWGLGYTAWTPVDQAPRVRTILDAIRGRNPDEDLNYILAIENDRIVFRATSQLGTFTQRTDSGLLASQRGLLTHFKTQYAGFTAAEVLELEDLINRPRTREQELQEFFEAHPHFLRIWDHREVFPHVYLSRHEEGDLIPDFVLLDRELQKATVMDLKLPSAKLIVHKDNRVRFAAAVSEARAQLQEYRRWFEERQNRQRLRDRLGMEIYQPRLAVVIGRSSDFASPYERQKVGADERDIEVVTYDDILAFARRRMMLIADATETGGPEKRSPITRGRRRPR